MAMFNYIHEQFGIRPMIRQIVDHMKAHPDKWSHYKEDNLVIICYELQVAFSMRYRYPSRIETPHGPVEINSREGSLLWNTFEKIEDEVSKGNRSHVEDLVLRRLEKVRNS